MHEQAAQRGGDVGAAADADPFERADRVEQPAVVHVEAGGAQHAAEQQHVAGEARAVAHVAVARAGQRAAEHRLDPLAAHRLDVFLVLEQDPERLLDRGRVELVCDSSATSAATQSSVSDTPAALYSSAVRSSCTNAVTCSASRAGTSGTLAATIRSSFVEVGIVDPAVEAAPLQRVVDLARAVRGDDDDRRLGGADGAELGNRDLKVGEQLEQVALELLVGAIDLVDEQHRRPLARLLDRAQQRPLDQERLGEQLALGAAGDRAPGCLRAGESRASAAGSSTRRRRG